MRHIENARNFQTVKARIAHDLCVYENFFVDGRVQRVGQLLCFTSLKIDNHEIVRRRVTAQHEGDFRLILIETNAANLALRNIEAREVGITDCRDFHLSAAISIHAMHAIIT